MNEVANYLRISEDYCRTLAGLRWSPDGEAVEFVDGTTFAFSSEIVSFLEGFASRRPLVDFNHALHFLYLLRQDRAPPGELPALREAFQATGKVHRNAGSFCAVLCADVPAVPQSPPAVAIWQQVVLRWYRIIEELALSAKTAQVPPLTPALFETRILQASSAYTSEEQLHWFKYGNGPVKDAAAMIAKEVAFNKPRSLKGVLADLSQRDRLAGAVPFVAQLVSALSLPPRRLARHELPVGGYSDVTTSGNPEQILPSQFALDDLEFLRRFAERELLYFRREEPHARTREELVVLVDQGVRTWGVVRLVLTAALFALGKLADRRKLPFLIASTSSGGVPFDPLQIDQDVIARRFEASDLSANPGLALERVLEESATTRDVVLLTHPRNLAENDVATAAKRAGKQTRVFAVAVTEHGDVQFSEMKRGVPVKRSQFQVDLHKSQPPPPQPAVVDAAVPWCGDVEPIGFPFRFGITRGTSSFQFDLDESGQVLLTASANGMLHAVRTDGSGFEVLPRGMVDNKVLREIRQVKGVADGFVVVGRIDQQLVVMHYHLGQRTCKAHCLGGGNWVQYGVYYYSDLHTIVVLEHYYGAAMPCAIDLGACEQARLHRTQVTSQAQTTDIHLMTSASQPALTPSQTRAHQACERALKSDLPSLELEIVPPGEHGKKREERFLELWPSDGTMKVGSALSARPTIRPMMEGQPLWKDQALIRALYANKTLIVLSAPTAIERGSLNHLSVLVGPHWAVAGEFRPPRDLTGVTLSSDGQLFARQIGATRVEVRKVADPSKACAVSPRGLCHNNISVQLAESWLSIHANQMTSLIAWNKGVLCPQHYKGKAGDAIMKELRTRGVGPPPSCMRTGRPKWLGYDGNRFGRYAVSTLVAAWDNFGQIGIYEHNGNLVCMIFAFRQQVAAWMPDGTCLGPPALLGRGETPGAAGKIGLALYEASRRGRSGQ